RNAAPGRGVFASMTSISLSASAEEPLDYGNDKPRSAWRRTGAGGFASSGVGCLSPLQIASRIVRGLRLPEPGGTGVGDGLQAVIFDSLAVVGGHARVVGPHDEVNRRGVVCTVRDCAEDVVKGVKPDPLAVQPDLAEQFHEPLGDLVGAVVVFRA